MKKPHEIVDALYRNADQEVYLFAAKLMRKRGYKNEKQLAEALMQKFGAPAKAGSMRSSPRSYRIFGERGRDIDGGAIEQMDTIMRLPVALSGALMPDAHLGYAMPIGGVTALDRAVSPSMVGYDIACRMTLSIIDGLTPAKARSRRDGFLRDIQSVTHFGMGEARFRDGKRRHEVMDDPLWRELNSLKPLRKKAQNQLGSSGGGNHFVDMVSGKVVRPAPWLPLSPGTQFVGLLTHSGSRGTGHKLATHYMKMAAAETKARFRDIPRGYEWLSTEHDAGREYLQVMELMGRYAQANHHLIHAHFYKETGLSPLLQLENHHNFAWVQPDGAIIHRKGATPAETGQPGLIPGSSAAASYLVEGLGESLSLHSSSHGAGRNMSRRQAKKQFNANKVRETYAAADVRVAGVGKDENPFAYKDIARVMALQEGKLVRTVAEMQPFLVVMGGPSDDGD